MPNEPQQTSVGNVYYDLISLLYHTLQASQTYASYINDAQQAGDQEAAQFFYQLQQEDSRRANYAMQLLAQRLGSGAARSSMGQSGMGQSTTR